MKFHEISTPLNFLGSHHGQVQNLEGREGQGEGRVGPSPFWGVHGYINSLIHSCLKLLSFAKNMLVSQLDHVKMMIKEISSNSYIDLMYLQ